MTSTELALREAVDGTVAQLRDPAFEEQVALAVPEGVSPRKLLRAAATAVLDNPDLAAPHLRPALIKATLKAAQDGLLPDGRKAAFVIFKGKDPTIAYMPMIGGLIDIAAEYGWSLFATTVHENDAFDPDPLDTPNPRANHKPPRFGVERGDVIGAYAVAQHRDGRTLLEIMDKAEIEKIRNVSRAKDRGPWVDWYEQMAAIRPARRLFKRLPLDPKDRERIDRVLAATGDDGVIELYGEESQEPHPGHARAQVAADSPALPPSPEPDQQPGGPGTDLPAAGADDVPFEGEEPTFEQEPTPNAEAKFTHGAHKDKTIAEVYALGKDGVSYLQWAYKAWKTNPMRAALDAFGQTHPDITP